VIYFVYENNSASKSVRIILLVIGIPIIVLVVLVIVLCMFHCFLTIMYLLFFIEKRKNYQGILEK